MSPTAFLVRVTDKNEADIAMREGADRIGLSDARGALPAAVVGDIVETVGGRCPVSAEPDVLAFTGTARERIAALVELGVTDLEFDAGTADAGASIADMRSRFPTLRSVVLLAPGSAEGAKIGVFAEHGVRAAMLRAPPGSQARLIDEPGIEGLAQFVRGAQRRGLAAWLGGALEPPDVPRMLALRPDVLLFRSSLCEGGVRGARLDPARVAAMRALIPARDAQIGDTPAQTDGAGHDEGVPTRTRPDKVFVRDFIVEAGIGAYRYEHRAPQRMRFNVDAELSPIPHDVSDMRDVFSYDVIVDAIRLATRQHVLLVERVALDVANATLRDPRVQRVRVRVEKLDILDGAVGVEIERT